MINDVQFAATKMMARDLEHTEKERKSIELRIIAFEKISQQITAMQMGVLVETVKVLKAIERKMLKDVAQCWKGTPLHEFVNTTLGLGNRLLWTLSLTHPLWEINNPAKVWKLYGLHPDGAKRRVKNTKDGFNRTLKSYILIYVAEAAMKSTHRVNGVTEYASPYRALYDQRRAHTELTHPPMSVSYTHLTLPTIYSV